MQEAQPFTIEIAGLAAQVHPLFKSTREYCRTYLSEKTPEMQISVKPQDLVFEQRLSEEEALQEGIRIRKFPDPFLERSAIQRAFAERLFDRETLLFHGSTVAVDGAAYVFTASCGTGKSTHTRLWCSAFGQRAVMVNDDKPFLRIAEETVMAYGSPWSGKHGLDTNIAAPLKGICILHRGAENRIRRMEPPEAMPMLLSQSYRPLAPEKEAAFRTLVEKLARTVPLWSMECNKDISAALTAYGAMSGQ